MAGETLATDAVVLGRRLPSDAFQAFTVFSPGHGVLFVLQRIPKRPSSAHLALDLFDEVALLLETSNQGQTWFVKEARLLRRHDGIGRDYERLRLASALTALVARNPPHEESRAPVHTLLRTALAAFAASDRPEIVYFKSLYSLARDEGYPVREQWLAGLPAAPRAAAERWLRTPLAELEQEKRSETTARLLPMLEDFLRHHTDILMNPEVDRGK